MSHRITTQRELRREFWETFPRWQRRKMREGEYMCDVRVAFCDWLDSLARNGDVSEALAQRATL